MIKSKQPLKLAFQSHGKSKESRTSRKDKLMVIFMRYRPQENSKAERDSPKDKVVGIEKHEPERLPSHGEIVIRDAHTDGQPDHEMVELDFLIHGKMGLQVFDSPCLDEERPNAANAPN
jgi:hypothetical protein